MRKCLLLVAMLLAVYWNEVRGQASLFTAPDTVCINQPVTLTPSIGDASNYYWGFCSGYLLNIPVADNLGSSFGFDNPAAIEVAKDGSDYYAFVITKGKDSLFRLAFGNSLGNAPTVTNFSNLSATVPDEASSLHIMKDSGRWFLFATGGTDGTNSTIARFDFGTTLANTPNSVNFGNVDNLLNDPEGIFVAKDANNFYYGFVVNRATNELLRLNFGANISLTPTATQLFSPGTASFNGPNDIAAMQDGGNWYMLVTNGTDNTVSRLNFGTTLGNIPVGDNVGTFGTLFSPSGINIIRDCGSLYAFVVNRGSKELVRINMPSLGGVYTADGLGSLSGGITDPTDISNMIRDHDSLFALVVNGTTNGVTSVIFPQCTSSTIPSSTSATPPVYEYRTPGLYNVYLAVDEGLPTARIECKQIRALPIPGMTLSNDTLICQGDTISLIAQVSGALSYTWSPNYNISDTTGFLVKVYPQYSVNYMVVIPFANGCIVDTVVKVTVAKNHADAGPDRLIADGTSTTLGGPMSTLGLYNTFEWTPNQFLNDGFYPYPVSKPAYDLTYYLTVSDTNGCVDIDTVVVRLTCDKIHLPNAFSPSSTNTGGSNRFGLLNRSIVKLNHFRIFDRWGKLMFETTDPTKEWDGTYNGSDVPMGVYVWDADGFCISGKRIHNSGNVTLIR